MTDVDERTNVLRILVSTDNHLGVWEKDPIRKDDSFVSFEEVMQKAAEMDVDMVLLGGDLFHDNKPSRATVVRAMDILSRHCLSDRPVPFQILSDQAVNFVSGKVNFENPNFNIGLPVFTIHGNHDDPAGVDNLSAVDLLSTANLVNYFGKTVLGASAGTDTAGKVRIPPVLVQKGYTKVALYGLGNIRDERLARLFQTPGSVEWVRPAASPAYPQDQWFNIFVLHQNRLQHSASAKNTIREGYLARFLDLVVWGHEHECIPEAWPSTDGHAKFSVCQPGSSVATALSEGEAKPKHCYLLEIMGDQYRLIAQALETVRPFVFESVTLADQLDPEAEDAPALVSAFLERRIEAMIKKGVSMRSSPKAPKLPLVRLRVDYTGFSTINAQRFGQKFVGKVANPHDLLLFSKAAARKSKPETGFGIDGLPLPPRPEAVDEQRIDDLIAEQLAEHKLEVLRQDELANALHSYVDQEEKAALADCISAALKREQGDALASGPAAVEKEGDVASLIAGRRQSQQDAGISQPRPSSRRPPQLSLAQPSDSGAALPDDMAVDDDLPSAPQPSARILNPAAQQRARGGAARAVGGRQATLGEAMARGRGQAAAGGALSTPSGGGATANGAGRSRQRGSASPAAKKAAQRTSRAKQPTPRSRHSSDISEPSGDEEEVSDGVAEEVDLISDSEDEALTATPPGGRKRRPAPGSNRGTGRGRKRGAGSRAAPPPSTATPISAFVDSDDEVPSPSPLPATGPSAVAATAGTRGARNALGRLRLGGGSLRSQVSQGGSQLHRWGGSK